MTRAIEVADGCWVVPSDVASICPSREEHGETSIIIRGFFRVLHAAASPAEVAAKLWPGEEADTVGFIERFHGVELHVLREAFHADKASVNSNLWRAVREYLGEE